MAAVSVVQLTNGGTKTYLSCADTAKLVRQALKNAFPGMKFSVKSHSYAGGASINVGWTDGPTEKDVDAIVGVYSGAGFDGMQDLQYHYDHWLRPDGSVVVAKSHHNLDGGVINAQPSPDAILVSFGADYIHTRRELSKDFRIRVAALTLATYSFGSALPAGIQASDLVEDTTWGPRWAGRFENTRVNGEWLSTWFHRTAVRLRGDGTLTHDTNGRDLLAAEQMEA